jgi:hypothetical protein
MHGPGQVVGASILARATRPQGTVTLIQRIRTARETPSGGSLGVLGGLLQVTSKIQRAMPRVLVHVSILAGGNRIGASKALIDGGPNLATSDDGCMSIILCGGGNAGINIHTTAAAKDRSRIRETGDRKRIGPNYITAISKGNLPRLTYSRSQDSLDSVSRTEMPLAVRPKASAGSRSLWVPPCRSGDARKRTLPDEMRGEPL